MKTIYYLYAYLFGRPVFSRFNNLVYWLALRSLGIYNYQNSKISGEQWLLNNVVKMLGRNLVIFDIGANVGKFSREVIEAEIDAINIYAFEPHPTTYLTLQSNVEAYKNVVPVMAALSDKEGEMPLFDREAGNGTSHASLAGEIFSEIHHVGKTEFSVSVETLDRFCSKNAVDKIDFLKIDVEGFELNVLRGASDMLINRKIRVIQFEFTQLNSVIGVFFKDIYDILSDDYDIYRLLPHGLYEISNYNPTMCEIFGYQNFAAILKSEV